MRRREFVALFGASVTWPFAALAQETGRTFGLGVLLPATRDVPVNKAFLDEFRRHSFIEGQNLTVEWRAYGPHPDLISQYAAELVEARVDVIAAGGVVGVRAAQQATMTIPPSDGRPAGWRPTRRLTFLAEQRRRSHRRGWYPDGCGRRRRRPDTAGRQSHTSLASPVHCGATPSDVYLRG